MAVVRKCLTLGFMVPHGTVSYIGGQKSKTYGLALRMASIAQPPYKKESAREFKRRRGVQLMEEGEDTAVIARVLGVSKASLYKWHRLLSEHGDVKFSSPTGRPRKLSNEQITVLGELLFKGATAHGWPSQLWTSDRVAAVIKRHFKGTCSHSTAWTVLKRYLGWTAQRPVQRFASGNEELIRRWKEVELTRIVGEVRQRRAHLVFLDESGFMLNPTVCRTFSPKGQKPVIKVGEPHARISVIGAISLSPIRKHLGVFHQLLPDNVNFRADSIVGFLREVSRHLSGPITFVCTACPIHCTKLMRAFLERHTSVEIEEFPPYAPEVNPVDKIWAYLKHNRL